MDWAFLIEMSCLVGLLLGLELKFGQQMNKGNWLISQIVQSVTKLAGDRAFAIEPSQWQVQK